MNTLTLALVLLSGDAEPLAETEMVHDFAKLTMGTARALSGKRALFKIEIIWIAHEINGSYVSPTTPYIGSCVSVVDPDKTYRAVYFQTRPKFSGEMTLEATLIVIHDPRRVKPDGSIEPACTEYRLVDVVRRK